MVKNLPAMQKGQDMPWFPSLGQEDPWGEGMATHSSILALENTMVRGAWQAAVHRVMQSWTRLKQLSTYMYLGFPGDSHGKESACKAGDLGLIPGLGRSPGEGMASHSTILAWRTPWTEESDGLQSIGW